VVACAARFHALESVISATVDAPRDTAFFAQPDAAWVGVRNIFMDYVPYTLLRLLLHGVAILLLAAYTAWAVQILWSV